MVAGTIALIAVIPVIIMTYILPHGEVVVKLNDIHPYRIEVEGNRIITVIE